MCENVVKVQKISHSHIQSLVDIDQVPVMGQVGYRCWDTVPTSWSTSKSCPGREGSLGADTCLTPSALCSGLCQLVWFAF